MIIKRPTKKEVLAFLKWNRLWNRIQVRTSRFSKVKSKASKSQSQSWLVKWQFLLKSHQLTELFETWKITSLSFQSNLITRSPKQSSILLLKITRSKLKFFIRMDNELLSKKAKSQRSPNSNLLTKQEGLERIEELDLRGIRKTWSISNLNLLIESKLLLRKLQ